MSQTIRAAAPHIFKRPVLSVRPDASMLEVATFLAVGPQIYADGLLVFDGTKLAGRIGGWSIANHILEKKEKWLQGSAADVMEPFDSPLDADGPLSRALEVFAATNFAFVPVAAGGEVAAFLTARDMLGAVSSTRKVAELASPVVAVSGDMNVPDAIKFMVEKCIRNLVVRNGAGRFANDRKVLEYMLSYEARKLAAKGGFGALARVTISDVGLTQGIEISPGTTAKEAARVMAETNPPCLFVQDMILTPWDLVMK